MSRTNDLLDRIHDNVHSIRPSNMADDPHSHGRLIMYRLATILSYLLLIVTGTYYTFKAPCKGLPWDCSTIWGQYGPRDTRFALDPAVGIVYWIVLCTLSLSYLATLFASPTTTTAQTNQAVQVAPHFLATNLLTFAFVHLWVQGHFAWGLFIAIVQFLQITIGYFRFPNTPNATHVPVFAMPLAFAFVTLYWDGATVVTTGTDAARIAGYIFLWSWLVYGGFYLVVFKDWTLGFSMAALSGAVGIRQALKTGEVLQYVFAFVILAMLFAGSVAVALPGILGDDPFRRGRIVDRNSEREPLVAED